MPEASREAKRHEAGEALTEFILSMFRANNVTLTWGDRLVAPFGLTSARWQILGAIAFADRAQPVAWLARDLGANRQNVQRIVNDLEKEGLVGFEANPHHRRAQLVVLTEKGQRTYDAAIAAYEPQVNRLAESLSLDDIKAAHRVMAVLREKLEGENEPDKQGIAR
ncbi:MULTISPECIES: MarR family winged helix-turn-helix transcriptional regulator [unclassified Rhizobium]|jgi:DNA-binding MarR family transcriptional regulator|uniref:MarR family winged helix-turn-helix transcriptional regulator n=1 Tax=unclassified Rhizobium TaxID=2613769 RepID=UPI000648E1D1|nr:MULTISPECIES: MarR family winged helix-turn-helix transcriptional regulator [unclassified Rhizobium]OJY74074.1 MAG: MarR family transcriptional regulator [Rhizobium sp. 60-20]RKD61500.1 DNA-binding MarR family transcriptional regulator [Rhizobium sp. WW_1]